MTFKIPELRMPSLEEHRAASAAWYSRIGPCLYENWPEPMKAMSFRTELLELSKDDQSALLDMFDGKGPAAANGLASRIDAALAAHFPSGVFAKLSSRSPKDAWCETFKCHSAHDILSLFASSERILDDLVQYKYLDHPCYLLLREWRDMPKQEEWRCFIRDKAVIGITQYHYTEDFRHIYDDAGASIQSSILKFLGVEVIPVTHTDPLVVDVWLRETPMLIEINPYGLSDPCLFTYGDLAGGGCGFRIADQVAAGGQ